MAIGLGCMRLSTDAARDPAHGRAVIAAAIDAGVTLLDTADAYALDDADIGHNELLIVEALGELRRDRPGLAAIEVVTKGGLIRPGGAWRTDGRARHLEAAARASRDRLGIAAIDLYLLHAVDPRVPLTTSVRALLRLRDQGVVRRIGLSNIGLTQLEAAIAVAAGGADRGDSGGIDAIEVELSPYQLDAVRGGLVAACAARGIRVLAHRPLGGPAGARRIAGDPVLGAIGARLGATPAEVALAWIASLAPDAIIPIPGATKIDTARSAGRAGAVVLDEDARAALAARFLEIGEPAVAVADPGGRPEIVMIMGMPASGKSTVAAGYAERGYLRLNRDERGGSLLAIARELDRALAGGARQVVIDNTYPTRASRQPVIEVARRRGADVRCRVMTTSIEQAQRNAVARILARHGRLLMPAGPGTTGSELSRAGEIDPRALFRFRRDYEPPRDDEGFATIEEIAFAAAPSPAPGADGAPARPALIVELDGIVWRGRPATPDAIALLPGAREAIAEWARDHVIAGTTWQPGLASADELAARLAELLGVAIDVVHCAHPPGPPVCWCRKPMPGLALALAHRHGLALARTLHVGKGPADRGFAARAGIGYADIAAGWPAPATVEP